MAVIYRVNMSDLTVSAEALGKAYEGLGGRPPAHRPIWLEAGSVAGAIESVGDGFDDTPQVCADGRNCVNAFRIADHRHETTRRQVGLARCE